MTDARKTESEEGEAGAEYLDYASPGDIIGDDSLDAAEKRKLLESWKMDLDSRLYAESEGMSKSEPLDASKEASLAEQERQVGKALEALDEEQS